MDFLGIRVEWFVAITFGILGIVALIAIFKIIQEVRRGSTNPTVDQVLNAVAKYAYFGIAAGERAVVWGLDSIEQYIDGTDKAAVANYVFNLLPETITVGEFTIPVNRLKGLVPRERWEAFVRDLYDEFNGFVKTHEAKLVDQLELVKFELDEDHPEDLAGEAEGWLTPTKS